ncbi:MAG: endonuclease/exonuclease/phosphatase family protein [Aeromonas veronii]
MKFVWWNTALSPAAGKVKSKATEEDRKKVCELILSFFLKRNANAVCLCEVSDKDILYFENYFDNEIFGINDLTHKAGKTNYDMAVIYRKETTLTSFVKTVQGTLSGNTIKSGVHLKVTNPKNDFTINIVLSHWPSRIRGDNTEKRIEAGKSLYSYVTQLLVDDNIVILMGDYNDNPFDQSIHKELKASRCHSIVRKYPKEFFFNPFWRTIISDERYHVHTPKNISFRSGTLPYKGTDASWHAFDQMMFSGNTISISSEWHLDEYQTGIIYDPDFSSVILDSRSPIDHYPIIGTIVRK